MRKKVDSFTLSELMVVLVIASMVVTIAFFSLNMVQRMVHNTQESFQTQQEVQSLERVLWLDINRYQATYNPTEQEVWFVGSRDSVRYQFLKTHVMRQKDTFDIQVTNLELKIDDETVSSGNFDALKVEFQQALLASELFVFKRKDAAFYMNE